MGASNTSDQDTNPQSGMSSIIQSHKSGFKGQQCSCTIENMIDNPNSEYECIKDHWPYPNQVQDPKPKSGTFRIPQSPESGLKGHGCSLHLQN